VKRSHDEDLFVVAFRGRTLMRRVVVVAYLEEEGLGSLVGMGRDLMDFMGLTVVVDKNSQCMEVCMMLFRKGKIEDLMVTCWLGPNGGTLGQRGVHLDGNLGGCCGADATEQDKAVALSKTVLRGSLIKNRCGVMHNSWLNSEAICSCRRAAVRRYVTIVWQPQTTTIATKPNQTRPRNGNTKAALLNANFNLRSLYCIALFPFYA
jgi:hypothetical protein